jgi:type II secretory pathway component PulJ
MLSRRVQRARQHRDAGVTLVELMVGMTLMTVVGAVALNFFVGTTAQANRVGEQSLVSGSARAAMTQIAKTLQVADSSSVNSGYATNRFVTTSPTEVKLYSNISPTDRSGTAIRTAPTEVDFSLVSGTLWESTYAPTGSATPASYPTSPTSRNVLITGVTNQQLSPVVPVFTYCSDATDPSVTCTATTNAASVAMVQVTITVQGLKGTAPQTVQTGIAITGAVS